MLSTYRAILRGESLEWRNEKPTADYLDHPVEVYVTILEEHASPTLSQNRTQGECMADALEKLAKLQSSSLLDDPAVWERDTRTDRTLPGNL